MDTRIGLGIGSYLVLVNYQSLLSNFLALARLLLYLSVENIDKIDYSFRVLLTIGIGFYDLLACKYEN